MSRYILDPEPPTDPPESRNLDAEWAAEDAEAEADWERDRDEAAPGFGD